MTQNFKHITVEDYVDESIFDLQDRDDTVLTMSFGISAPSYTMTDLIWNDAENNVLKRWTGSVWESIVNYTENYANNGYLTRTFQPLSSVLTNYSIPSISGLGFINTEFVPFSYFFRDTLLSDFKNGIGLKALAYKSKIGTSDISDGVISNVKLNPSIIDNPPFKVGDCIPSMNSGNKRGCIKLSNNASIKYTIGGYASGSTYKGDTYKNLFQFIWNNYNLPIYTSTGVVTSKSSSWTEDWNNNKRLELPHIDIPVEDPNAHSSSYNAGDYDGFFPEAYGRIESYNRAACLTYNFKDWGIGVCVKFTNGALPGFIPKNGSTIEWGSFESGFRAMQPQGEGMVPYSLGASPDGYGNLYNCEAGDGGYGMKWRRFLETINMLSYTDATIMGFHNGDNTVWTNMFPGYIEDKDGGAFQVLTIQLAGRSVKYMYPREYSPVVQADETLWVLYNSFTYFMKY